MSKPISRLWLLGPPFAILLSILVYYAKFRSVREWVDARFPWVAENVGSRLPDLPEAVVVRPAPHKEPAASSSPAHPVPGPEPTAPAPEAPNLLAPPKPPSFFAPDGSVDIGKLAVNRTEWPKS